MNNYFSSVLQEVEVEFLGMDQDNFIGDDPTLNILTGDGCGFNGENVDDRELSGFLNSF